MASDFYDVSGAPGTKSFGASATIRSEFALIAAAFAKLPALGGNGDEILKVNAGGTAIETVASLGIAQGGTGAASLTDHGILLGSGTSAITATGAPTNGQVLVGVTGSDPELQSGATLRTSLGLGTTDSPTFAALTLTAALTIANGGTGTTSLTDHGILLGSGVSAVTATDAPTNGQVLVGVTGSDPALQSGATLRTSLGLGTGDSPTFAGLTLSTPLAVAQGGTGAATFSAGYVLLGNGTGAIQALNLTAKGSIIVGDGTTAPQALTVGTDAYVLTADAASALGVKWTALGGASGVGTLTTVKGGGIQVGDADIATLDFSGLYFTVTETPNTEINISMVTASVNGPGVIEIATQSEVNLLSSAELAVTPATLGAFPGHTNTVTVGTLTSGAWHASVIDVTYGGTGAASLTDGGHLLGNGTNPIEVTTRPALGEVLVGQNSGSPVLQSGATFRASLGIVNNVSHTGDATGDTALTITAGAVSNSKLASMVTQTIKGRFSGGTGEPEDLTATQLRSLINVENGATADMTATEIRTALLGVDGSGSGIDADLLDGVQGSGYVRVGTGGPATLARYDSVQIALPASGATSGTLTHLLGGVPTSVMAYLHCISADDSYAAGDEVPFSQCTYNGYAIPLGITANATQVIFTLQETSAIWTQRKAASSYQGLVPSKWRVIVHAEL